MQLITPGRIGLKFDIFELMFYEILVMHIHDNHLVYNIYERQENFFFLVLHVLCDFWFYYFYTETMIGSSLASSSVS